MGGDPSHGPGRRQQGGSTRQPRCRRSRGRQLLRVRSPRGAARLALAWMWIGAFATLWAVGEAIVTFYDFARNGVIPFPSAADAGLLVAMPLAAIGVLLFPSAPRLGVSRARMPLDGVIVAGSLLILSWTTALGTVYHSGSGSVFSQAVGLAYPISDVIVATVGISVLARGRNRQRVALVLVVVGLVCFTATDSSLAYLGHMSSFRYDTLVDAGRVAGLLLIALAPLWSREPAVSDQDETEGPSLWQVALPYFFLAIAITAAAIKDTQTHHLGLFVVIAGLVRHRRRTHPPGAHDGREPPPHRPDALRRQHVAGQPGRARPLRPSRLVDRAAESCAFRRPHRARSRPARFANPSRCCACCATSTASRT